MVLSVVVRVHANLQGVDVNHTEDELITRITELLSGRSQEDSSRILEVAQLRIIGAKKGESVVLFVFCKTLTELLDLKEMQLSGELKSHLQTLFTQVISRSQFVEVNAENLSDVVESLFEELFHRSNVDQLEVTFTKEEFETCMAYFPGYYSG